MFKFLWWVLRCAGAVLLFFACFIEESGPAYERFADWEEEDDIGSGNSTTIGRTSVGGFEPTMTSTWGESVGRMSGARIK